MILILLSLNIVWCSASFNLYKSSHPTRKTTELFERLAYHELITFSHNQFHLIDGSGSPVYPMNGRLSFNAFGHHYSLLIRKNVELFADSYHTETHRYNEEHQRMDKVVHSTRIPECYYTAEVESDASDTGYGLFSACKGRGIRGWIDAFGEKIVIRPALHLMNVSFIGDHLIKHDHIVYRERDLDRSDYPQDWCGHVHVNNDSFIADHDEKETSPPPRRTNEWRRRRLQSESTRYVELAIVNDPGMMEEEDYDKSKIEDKTVSIVATLQKYYLNADLGVGSVQIVLSAIFYVESFDPLTQPDLPDCSSGDSPDLYDSSPPSSGYCEVGYSSYLSNFHSYRKAHLSDYDNAQLFSYYDFHETVIGYASLPGLCRRDFSGGIEQCTYDDEYNANIVAHELGHNFNMQHDGNGNTCSPSKYIMASTGNPDPDFARPDEFSSCSSDYVRDFFSQYSMSCTANKPLTTRYAVCRNGFVEEGESCDCGSSSCESLGDPCCDGSTCALYASYECSNDDACCSDCTLLAAGTVCRELDVDNDCDIAEELCTGDSSECPPDYRYVEGTWCWSPSGDSFGYCYSGECMSLEKQCTEYGVESGTDFSVAPTACPGVSAPDWQVESCGSRISCARVSDSACVRADEADEGIPCNNQSQCIGGQCEYSSSIYTFKWTSLAWDECNMSCKADDEEGTAAGYQTRVVECTFQNGTAGGGCDDEFRPIDGRICNDFVCDFCAIQPNGATICGDHGTCEDDLKICDCDSGWSGDRCDEAPSLRFLGIVSQIYHTANRTVKMRINPCGTIAGGYDNVTHAETIVVSGNLSSLLVGASVGVRWMSTGDIALLAVGLVEVDAESGQVIGDFPLYVGSSLAHDDSTCDVVNTTEYDGCFVHLDCNDFTFTIPLDLVPSSYKLLIRFNNEFAVESPVVDIECNEYLCGDHGTCGDDGCVCEHGWSGESCAESLCTDWSFALCDLDEFGNCGSTGSTVYKAKCFNSTCDLDDQCGATCSDPNFEGQYCEVPSDFCATLLSQIACNDATLSLDSCIWTDDRCLYKECASFTTESECESWTNGSASSSFAHENRWNTFCEWNSEGYCNRITCTLPSCANDAVRRPLLFELPICRAWYCDCNTVNGGYWTSSTPQALLSSSDEALLTCAHCSLSCESGAQHADDACDACNINCPVETEPYRSGIECAQVFWIGHFRCDIDSSIYIHKQSEFETLIIQDLAYFLSTKIDRISIWQIKPDGDTKRSIVYFRYLFETNDEDVTQIIGGDVMHFAAKEIADPTSSAVRGFIMQYTDSTYAFDWCVPTKEPCDASQQISILFIFYICCGGSFGAIILGVIAYRCATASKRQKAYEAKVRQVRQAQLRLMEHHSKARRVGMRDVSKHRAHKIHKAHKKQEKEQLNEIKHRAKEEKKLNKLQPVDPTPHNKNDSTLELDQFRRYSADVAQPQQQVVQRPNASQSVYSAPAYQPPNASNNRPFASQSVHSNALPPSWKIYYNDDGIPYYFNSQTGQTTWRRP